MPSDSRYVLRHDILRYMGKMESVEAAEAAGYRFEMRAHEQRLVALKGETVVGFAHFSNRADGSVDFDSTVVEPHTRGTGMAKLIVQKTLADEMFENAKIRASCWYVDGLLAKHPEYLPKNATLVG